MNRFQVQALTHRLMAASLITLSALGLLVSTSHAAEPVKPAAEAKPVPECAQDGFRLGNRSTGFTSLSSLRISK